MRNKIVCRIEGSTGFLFFIISFVISVNFDVAVNWQLAFAKC
jgi:hypothetical protein